MVLSPFVRLSLNLNSSAAVSTAANVLLIGYAEDTSDLTVNINEPVELGTITSVSTAVQKLKAIGLKVSMTGLTTYDKSQTDEISQMVIQALATYQAWQPYLPANFLRVPKFYISVLDRKVNAKEVVVDPNDPSNDRTPYGNLFKDIIAKQIELTTIVPSYKYIAGDNDLSDSYITQLKAFVDTQLAKANPNLGFLCPVFHTDLSKTDSVDNIGNINILRSVTVTAYQDPNNTKVYQLQSAAVGSSVGLVVAALPDTCEGLVYQNIPNMPRALELGLYTDENIEDFLQKGISPIVYNSRVGEQQFNRVVTSTILDPNLGVSRSNALDIQDYKGLYSIQLAIFNKILFSKDIINKRTVITRTGVPSTVTAIKNIVLGELVTAEIEGLILQPEGGFQNSVEAFVNPDNPNQIVVRIKVIPSSIVYQVSGEIEVNDSSSIFSELLINV